MSDSRFDGCLDPLDTCLDGLDTRVDARADADTLARTASDAHAAGDLDGMIAALEQLEEIEPDSSDWPRRRAAALGRLGDRTGERLALERSARLDAHSGRALQATAACRLVLSMDPRHRHTQDEILGLAAAASNSLPEGSDSRFTTPDFESSLDRLELAQIFSECRPCPLWDDGGTAREIPLEEVDGQSPGAVAPGADAPGADEVDVAIQTLKQTPFLGRLDPQSLDDLIAVAGVVEIAEGETLHRQGDRDHALYAVAHGELARWVELARDSGEPPARRRVPDLRAGDFFGELGIVTRHRAEATVEALRDTRLLRFDRRAVWRWLDGSGSRLTVLLRFLRECSVERLFESGELDERLGDVDRASIVERFRLLEVDDGTVVMERPGASRGLVALLAGRLQLLRRDDEGDKVLFDLEPGAICSESTIPSDEAESAAVVATGKAWILELSAEGQPETS